MQLAEKLDWKGLKYNEIVAWDKYTQVDAKMDLILMFHL
jgi:hypothetical protein